MKIIINGACGRMGKVLSECAVSQGIEIAARVDALKHGCGEDGKIYASLSEVNNGADALIDFSHHSATPDIVAFAKRTNIPCVIATTGHNESESAMLSELSKTVPVFVSRNMSLGVNIVIGLCRDAVRRLSGECDIEIIEKHHRTKLDAPSGPALMIAEEISKEMKGNTDLVFDRTKRRCVRPDNEIGISSVRAGNIFGEHEIIISAKGETISIKHTAESRDLFALGALKAASFLCGRVNGYYTMEDLLKSASSASGQETI